jgi:hypothetical protein
MRSAGILALAVITCSQSVHAQRSRGITLGMNGNGLSIGDVPRTNGIRLNYRDRFLEVANGVNATIWTPYGEAGGDVNGLALGLPVTGAARISGLTLALFGAGASESIRGIGIAPIGLGAGEDLWGLMIGGVGVGTGNRFTGIGFGGVGVGGGGPLKGLMIGGVGVGGGGSVTGISLAGGGVGGGGDITGLNAAIIGVGGGGNIRGISLAGLGVGGGGDITGISFGGVGVGSGGTLRGFSMGLVGVGAPEIRGIAMGGLVGGEDVVAGVLAPVHFRIGRGGYFNGLAVSSVSYVNGEQKGVTVGLVNYARRLRGLQIGVLNYARDNPRGLRLLPLVNFHID